MADFVGNGLRLRQLTNHTRSNQNVQTLFYQKPGTTTRNQLAAGIPTSIELKYHDDKSGEKTFALSRGRFGTVTITRDTAADPISLQLREWPLLTVVRRLRQMTKIVVTIRGDTYTINLDQHAHYFLTNPTTMSWVSIKQRLSNRSFTADAINGNDNMIRGNLVHNIPDTDVRYVIQKFKGLTGGAAGNLDILLDSLNQPFSARGQFTQDTDLELTLAPYPLLTNDDTLDIDVTKEDVTLAPPTPTTVTREEILTVKLGGWKYVAADGGVQFRLQGAPGAISTGVTSYSVRHAASINHWNAQSRTYPDAPANFLFAVPMDDNTEKFIGLQIEYEDGQRRRSDTYHVAVKAGVASVIKIGSIRSLISNFKFFQLVTSDTTVKIRVDDDFLLSEYVDKVKLVCTSNPTFNTVEIDNPANKSYVTGDVTGLVANTQYTVRIDVVWDDIEYQGESFQFTTAKAFSAVPTMEEKRERVQHDILEKNLDDEEVTALELLDFGTSSKAMADILAVKTAVPGAQDGVDKNPRNKGYRRGSGRGQSQYAVESGDVLEELLSEVALTLPEIDGDQDNITEAQIWP